MSNLIFSLNAVLPVFLLIVLGLVLKRVALLDDAFVAKSSRLVFKVALPVLIFRTIGKANFREIYNGKIVLAVVLLITVGFLILFLITPYLIKDGAARGAFVQGAFRSNTAIVGLAIIANVFGESGLAKAAFPMMFVFPMYNIYSVVALTVPLKGKESGSSWHILKMIFSNPLIIAVLISLPFSYFSIQVPIVLDTFLSYLARMALPLALLGVGASLSFHSLRKKMKLALWSSFVKIVIYPLVTVFVLVLLSINNENFGVIFIMMACPTAVSGFVMADAMGSDSELTAGIILITTLGSIFTIGLGLFLLKTYQLI